MARHRAVARSVAAAQARHRPRPLPYFDLGIQRHRSPVRRADRRRHRRIGRLPARHRRGGRRRTQARQARPRTRQGRFRLRSQRFHTGRIRRRARQTRAARQRGRVAYCGSVEPSRRGRFARCVRIRVLHRPPDRNIQGLHAPHGTGRHSAGDPSPGQHSGHFGPPGDSLRTHPPRHRPVRLRARSRDGHPARLASDPGHAPAGAARHGQGCGGRPRHLLRPHLPDPGQHLDRYCAAGLRRWHPPLRFRFRYGRCQARGEAGRPGAHHDHRRPEDLPRVRPRVHGPVHRGPARIRRRTRRSRGRHGRTVRPGPRRGLR